MTTALPYQIEGIDFLASRPSGLLADAPGLGKSFQAIRAADKARILKALIICPASVVPTWRYEMKTHRQGDWQGLPISYEQAVAPAMRARIMRDEFDLVVLDEAHYLKEVNSRRTKAIYGFNDNFDHSAAHAITSRAAQVFLLTGTPMPNNPGELYPHIRLFAPQTILAADGRTPWSLAQFQERYCRFVNPTGRGRRIVGGQNEDELHQKLKSFMLRRKKEDVLKDLPPLTFGEVIVEGDVTGLEVEDAPRIAAALAEHGAEGLGLLRKDRHVSAIRRYTGLAKVKPAAAWVKDWLASHPPHEKIVVFAHHSEVIDALARDLEPLAVTIRGSSTPAKRESAVRRFQKDPHYRVFIGQIIAAGTGITLTAASDMLFVESSWVPAEVEQAAMRIHRIGQTRPCVVRYCVLEGSIDEAIQRALMRKSKSIAAVVDGV